MSGSSQWVQTRAASRSAATSGSAVAKTSSTKTTSAAPTAADGTSQIHSSKGPWIKNLPAPMYKPYVTPGQPARVGHEMSRGYIAPLRRTTFTGLPNPYMFLFHYNPMKIDVATNSQDSAQIANQSPNDAFVNLLAHSGNYHIEFILDRSQEVAANAKSNYTGPTGTKNFRDMGTMYDIEFLYRTFNGPPGGNMRVWAISNSSSNYGFMTPTPCKVWVSNALQFTGFPSNLNIQHQMYTPLMVPTITTVSLDFIGVVRDLGLDGTVGSALANYQSGTGTTWTPTWGSNGATQGPNSAGRI